MLWFAANWALNASLDYTSVASATILSSMSGELRSFHVDVNQSIHFLLRFFHVGSWSFVSSGNINLSQDRRSGHQVRALTNP